MFFTVDSDKGLFSIAEGSKQPGWSMVTHFNNAPWFIVDFKLPFKVVPAVLTARGCSKLVGHLADLEGAVLASQEKGWQLVSVTAIIPRHITNAPYQVARQIKAVWLAEDAEAPHQEVYIVESMDGEYVLKGSSKPVTAYRKKQIVLDMVKLAKEYP